MKHPSKPFSLLSLLALAPLAGCATISPPPAAMALGGASTGPVGGTSVTAFGGLAGGVFINGGVGGGARVDHRLTNTVAVGVDGVVGSVVDPSSEQAAPRTLFAGRAHVQVNPGASEHVALTFGGGGGGTDNALSYVTLDAGARVSGRWASGFFEPYVGGLVALSVPTGVPDGSTRGDNDRRFLPTGYLGANGGVALHPTERLAVMLDLMLLGGYSASNNALLATSMLGLRYTFGGELQAR